MIRYEKWDTIDGYSSSPLHIPFHSHSRPPCFSGITSLIFPHCHLMVLLHIVFIKQTCTFYKFLWNFNTVHVTFFLPLLLLSMPTRYIILHSSSFTSAHPALHRVTITANCPFSFWFLFRLFPILHFYKLPLVRCLSSYRYVTTIQGQKLSDFLIKKKSHSEKYIVHYNLILGLFQLKQTFYCIFSSAISLNSGSWTIGEHEIPLANSEKYLSKSKRKKTDKN